MVQGSEGIKGGFDKGGGNGCRRMEEGGAIGEGD